MKKTITSSRTAIVPLVATLGLAFACASGPKPDSTSVPAAREDTTVARPPYDRFYVDFKETLDEQFVYVEATVPADDMRTGIAKLLAALERRGVDAAGDLFIEYLDDPRPIAASLRQDRPVRLHIGVPVDAPVEGDPELRYAVAAPRTVVYARVAGPFGAARRAFPALDAHMDQWGWIQHGPVREIYASAPEGGFIVEVQVPWAPGR